MASGDPKICVCLLDKLTNKATKDSFIHNFPVTKDGQRKQCEITEVNLSSIKFGNNTKVQNSTLSAGSVNSTGENNEINTQDKKKNNKEKKKHSKGSESNNPDGTKGSESNNPDGSKDSESKNPDGFLSQFSKQQSQIAIGVGSMTLFLILFQVFNNKNKKR
jgi:hypothetical protein